jgi:hypothetical protein
MDITVGTPADVRVEPVFREPSAEQRLAFLAEASQLLASLLEYQTILWRVAHLAAPVLGERCAVHALKDGAIRPVARAWADRTDDDEVRALLSAYFTDGHDPPAPRGARAADR